ncbi:39S ribosomal protein L50, mitochondrial isoform X1 [Anastrepha obliqua]|uniref:39S ribosomal protein L50, mitochondrial isoform X1 n=1 Tax=Anastrepha obliqua TaxID=95512 RepID=UPI002409B05C|nr:39S ribosomal protein L50, mitochondrial isoform X1 [Anastrepha obliqua]
MSLRKNIQFLAQTKNLYAVLNYSTSPSIKPQSQRNVADVGKSLSSKGFLRSHKPYEPVQNITDKVRAICINLKISTSTEYKLTNLEEKFRFLDACFKDFQHSVPNSQVHELQSIGDVIQFYETPVNTTIPYDALKNADLPENLHIQYEYLRFHPDTDTKFNGQTAFPKSSTLVTGLKYRGKYEGHEAKRSWP